jgi:hypothetical protein
VSVDELLDRLVPEPTAFGDWDDVLGRARISKRPQRLLVAAALALLVIAFFVSPAFGLLRDLIGRTDVTFSHSQPAPTRVQREFFDLSRRGPKGLSPQAIASQTRVVGRFAGRDVYVAPTRQGGLCWQVERFMGGCDTERPSTPLSLGTSVMVRKGERARVVVGVVFARRAQRVVAEYADGAREPIRFLWLSKPVDAGIFWFTVPPEHRTTASRFLGVAARDGSGKLLARQWLDGTAYPPIAPHPRPLPKPRPTPAPTTPVQRGSANGVTVVVGANGVAEFHTSDPKLRRSAWGCFQFMQYHRVVPFGANFGPHGSRIELWGLTPPVDGCEVERGNGHVWPDPQGYHAAAEIAFTPRARRYFADRAAARELSLFVHWFRRHDHVPTTGITVAAHGDTTTYSVRSRTGKVFHVTLQGRKVVGDNLGPFKGQF